jgi:leader peptidase (prepilin peptidase)/N-methyltransferase
MALVVTAIFVALAFTLGTGAGLIVNIVATRLAANRPLSGRLRCTRSPHVLHIWQALPLVGFLVQRGRCATCGRTLPISYPLIELTSGTVFAILYALEGWSLSFAFYAAYAAILLLVLIIDLRYREIYLTVIAVGSVIALVGSVLLPGGGLFNALIGAVVAGSFFLLAYLLARLLFRHIEEPLGAGDVFLALMIGLMLGFPNVVGALLIGPLLAGAAAIALLVSRRSKLGDFIPYGVALCVAAMLFLISPAPFADALKLHSLTRIVSELFH